MSVVDFVITSEVTIGSDDADLLASAFQDRVRLVEGAPGFRRIEVWRDIARPGVFQMVSWWHTAEDFRAYMRSEEHRCSHARIPGAPHKPRGTGVRRYTVVPDVDGDRCPVQPGATCTAPPAPGPS
jgi:heme-degrading monooxygenase HmoA